MNVTVRGKRWKLVFERIRDGLNSWGFCDAPTTPGKHIRIDSRLSGQHRLEILLHEILHAAHWDASEELVQEFAEDAARILTKLGYTNESTQATDGDCTRDR